MILKCFPTELEEKIDQIVRKSDAVDIGTVVSRIKREILIYPN